jgi:hypothetical protein
MYLWRLNSMTQQPVNPLTKHFRQPAIYLKLPSKGRFYADGTLDLAVTGSIPVYPMTVKDELTLKTPDALMNGEGLVNVIKSCCPSIKDPWAIPAPDLDAIFIAVRLASYGQGMDITSTCPHCDAVSEHTIDLNVLLDNLSPCDYTETLAIDDLVISFKPQLYKNINDVNIVNFEQKKLVNNIVDAEIPDDEKKSLFEASFARITNLNVSMVISSIASITAGADTVSDEVMIKEFLDNCSRQTYKAIKEKINELALKNAIAPVNLQCENEECAKTYTAPLTFDQSNFFV